MGHIKEIPPYKPKPQPAAPDPTQQGKPTVPTTGNNPVTIASDVLPPNINVWAEDA